MQIPPHTIDGENAEVVDMKISIHLGFFNFIGIYLVQPVNLTYFGGEIVVQPLEGIIHVTVFVYFPVHLLEVLVYKINLHLVGNFSQSRVLISVYDI